MTTTTTNHTDWLLLEKLPTHKREPCCHRFYFNDLPYDVEPEKCPRCGGSGYYAAITLESLAEAMAGEGWDEGRFAITSLYGYEWRWGHFGSWVVSQYHANHIDAAKEAAIKALEDTDG